MIRGVLISENLNPVNTGGGKGVNPLIKSKPRDYYDGVKTVVHGRCGIRCDLAIHALMLATSLLRFPPESKSVLGMEKPPFGHLSHTHRILVGVPFKGPCPRFAAGRTNPLTGMVQSDDRVS